MMTYEQWETMTIDYLDGNLSPREKEEFEAAMEENPDWMKELKEAGSMIEKLAAVSPVEIPEKTEQMVNKIIDGETDIVSGKKSRSIFKELTIPFNNYYRLAYAAGLIMFGFFLGHFGFLSNGDSAENQVSLLQNELSEMRQLVSLSMLKQQSPSARLQGIRFTAQVENPDNELVLTIIRLLKTDPNVNVRLAAVEALHLFKEYPSVKISLIEALQSEKSPLVQVAIIDLLVDIKENRAIEALRQIMDDEENNIIVREKAESGIKKLS